MISNFEFPKTIKYLQNIYLGENGLPGFPGIKVLAETKKNILANTHNFNRANMAILEMIIFLDRLETKE